MPSDTRGNAGAQGPGPGPLGRRRAQWALIVKEVLGPDCRPFGVGSVRTASDHLVREADDGPEGGGRPRRGESAGRTRRGRRAGWSAACSAALTSVLLASIVGVAGCAARGHQGAAVSALGGRAAAESVAVRAGGEPDERTDAEVDVDWDAVLGDALGEVSGDDDAAWSLALLDTASGDGASYGEGAFDTASVVKVDILAALLLRAQDAGRSLTAQEQAYAEVMIENSDNRAATALWRDIGGSGGLDAANRRFGLTSTKGGDGLLWGLTQTTAADQLRLLRAVFLPDDDPVLHEPARAYVRTLMGRVQPGQDWGVPSAAAEGTAYEVKNGWLQRTATGRWDINSIGRVTSGGHRYLVAVLSKGSSTQASGIRLVEAAARAAVRAFDAAGGRSARTAASASPSASPSPGESRPAP